MNRSANLAQEIYQQIKHDIVTCVLAPGQPLNERELAERLNVSKTPIREALMRLQQDNLVEVIPRRGYLVSNLTLKDIQDIFELRQILERAVFALAIKHITDTEIDELESIMEVSYDEDPKSEELYIQANISYHMAIAGATNNNLLMRHYEQVLTDSTRLMYLDLKSREVFWSWQHGHRDMIDALRSRDIDAAMAAVDEALAEGRMRMLNP